LMQQCWSSTESCERRLKRKLWSRAFQWAVVCTIPWRIGAAASNRRSHDFGLRFWEQWREVGGDQWERKKILSYPGNLNIPGCKNLLVPKYSQHQKKFYNIPGCPISARYQGTVFTVVRHSFDTQGIIKCQFIKINVSICRE
jgi:hypothetical protein